MPVKKGDIVKVDYEGKLEDGTVFDASANHGKPLEFEAGAGLVIKGFDNAILGMKKGEEKEINIPCAQAYGDVRPEMIKKVPRDQLPKEHEPKPGMMLIMGTPEGNQIPCKIVAVTDTEVSIDLNHPLAGKNLIFKVKVLEYSAKPADKK